MNPVQETLEMVGIDDRIGAAVPAAIRRPRFGVMPRATRSVTSGSPTPSSPSTATFPGRSSARAPPPRRSRSSHPTGYISSCETRTTSATAPARRRAPVAHVAPPVLAQGPHPLFHSRLFDQPRRGALEDQALDGVGHGEQLVDTRAAAVARVGAFLAATPLDGIDLLVAA